MSAAALVAPLGYVTSAQHLEAEFGRLDLILRLQAGTAADPALLHRLEQVAAEIGARVAATLCTAVELRLVTLAELFDLAPFDVDVIVFCLAPEIDERYGQAFADLRGGRAPTAGLVLDALCSDMEARLAARARLTESAPLRRHGLVVPVGPEALPALRLDPRILRFLLDDDEIDDRLRATCTLATPEPVDLVVPAELGARLAALAAGGGEHPVVHLWGRPGVGRRSAAANLVAAWGGRQLIIDAARPVSEPFGRFAELVGREARLQGATPVWTDVDGLEGDAVDVLMGRIAAQRGPTILIGEAPWRRPACDVVSLEVPPPGHPERLRLWSAALADPAVAAAPGVDGAAQAVRRLTGGQIGAAVASARHLAAARSPAAPVIEAADLDKAARRQSPSPRGGLARRISPRHGWDALVLPAEQLAQLREIVAQVVLRPLVHEAWSCGPTAGGRGVNVLFTGPRGTGRTLAAEALAHALHLDLDRVDPSAVTTAADLGRAIEDAVAGNAVLLVDEADAVLGERGVARALDEHDGVVVLAAGRREPAHALAHRLHAVVEFPMPDAAQRLRIWERVWPDAVPRAADLDLELLAREIELPGGGIRSIAVASAFLAAAEGGTDGRAAEGGTDGRAADGGTDGRAADGGAVAMRHVVRATRREYEKRGEVGPTAVPGSG